MKKILFVCDVNNFPAGAFKFIESLHEQEPVLLTGAFFHSENFDVTMPTSLVFAPDPLLAFTDADTIAVKSSIEKFERKCQQQGIEYRVHEESEVFKLDDLVKETRFADVMVLSDRLFFSHLDPEQPNSYMKDALHASECPVMIVPEDYSAVTNITIAYDGTKESMFALKQFCYLFPEFTNLKTEIVYWVDKTDDEMPDMEYIEEFGARHFTDLNFKQLFFDPKKYIADWVRKNKGSVLIAGSYKRSWLSSLLNKSFVEDIIKNPPAVIFIAHNC